MILILMSLYCYYYVDCRYILEYTRIIIIKSNDNIIKRRDKNNRLKYYDIMFGGVYL